MVSGLKLQVKFNVMLCALALLSLSACGRLHPSNFKPSNHDLFSTNAGEAQQAAESSMPPAVTSLPVQNPSRQSAIPVSVGAIEENSVEIFDLEPIAGYTRGAPQRPFNANNYGTPPSPMTRNAPARNDSVQINPIMAGAGQAQGRFASDKSVTIYDFEGQEVQTGFDFARAGVGAPYNNSVAGNDTSGRVSQARAGNQIFFKHGSSRLGAGDMRKLSTMAEEAKFAPVDYIAVEGYASRPTQAGKNTTEAHIINLRQSMKRSEKVSKALIAKGVPGEKIKTVSWGATKASGDNAYDRRVDVNIGGQ